MSHEFQETEYPSHEHLTDEEVEAIVKRYGESQAGSNTQPTVKDVAEALHVEPGVVAKLLSDVRSAKTQEDLKTRLDTLEAENAELRQRAEKSNYHTNEMWDDYSAVRHRTNVRSDSGRRFAVVLAVMFAAMFLLRGARGIGNPSSIIWPVLGLLAALFIIKRFLRLRR